MAPPPSVEVSRGDTPSPELVLPPGKAKRAAAVAPPPPHGFEITDRLQCPDWIAAKLGVSSAAAANLEVAQSSEAAYNSLTRFLALVAVDADGPPPKPVDLFADPSQSPGPLRALALQRGTGTQGTTDTTTPATAVHVLGLGYARVRTGGADVYVQHFARGRPLAEFRASHIFRTVAMFALSADTLRQTMADALAWQHEHDKMLRTAKDGKYTLCTLEVEECGTVRWRNHGQKDARPLDSIFLREGQQEAIVKDFKSFRETSTKDWYLRHGLPYRRSYLFYGPPGVGKTSLIRGLAGELKLTTCFLCLADKKMGNQQLQEALMKVPKPSLIVLEDVDVLFNEQRKSESVAPLTFSGLLNAMDGLISAEGTLTIMTTNHIERLDPALIRAGRVDRRFEFGNPDRAQVVALFKSYYPECDMKLAKEFAAVVFKRQEPSARSIATLQQLFVYCREDSAQTCFDRVEEFFKEFYPNDREDPHRRLFA